MKCLSASLTIFILLSHITYLRASADTLEAHKTTGDHSLLLVNATKKPIAVNFSGRKGDNTFIPDSQTVIPAYSSISHQLEPAVETEKSTLYSFGKFNIRTKVRTEDIGKKELFYVVYTNNVKSNELDTSIHGHIVEPESDIFIRNNTEEPIKVKIAYDDEKHGSVADELSRIEPKDLGGLSYPFLLTSPETVITLTFTTLKSNQEDRSLIPAKPCFINVESKISKKSIVAILYSNFLQVLFLHLRGLLDFVACYLKM